MASIEIREMTRADQYYVGTCTHLHESKEIDACATRRIAWMEKMIPQGLQVTTAIADGHPGGFLYLLPIEICPWGPLGTDLAVIPCLCVENAFRGKGIGKALLEDAEQRSRRAGFKGITLQAYSHDFWFMPVAFFLKHGFEQVDRRGTLVLLWKTFDPRAGAPRLMESRYQFHPIAGKVVVDLFWNQFCQTSDIEAQRVREVVAEFGDSVILHKYPAGDRNVLLRYQVSHGIYINGREIFWGYEAPKEGIREAIEKALAAGRRWNNQPT
ncbi:MAG: GNAT family N-acetyltransferase [Spirochaetota bacterium]